MGRKTDLDRVVVINDDAVERGGAAGIALAGARRVAARGVPVTFPSGNEDLAPRGIATMVLGGWQLLARDPWSADVVFVGRLDGDKGAHLLARAVRRAGARLSLIDDGPLAPEIARLLSLYAARLGEPSDDIAPALRVGAEAGGNG